jgi:DNA replication protein DnaC
MYDEMHNDGELPEEYSSPYLAKYIRTVYDVVVLDGLGEENDTEFTRRSIMTLLSQRVNAQLPTIVTSLYNPKKLALRYGDRFVSILQSVCRLIPVSGTDQRNAGK